MTSEFNQKLLPLKKCPISMISFETQNPKPNNGSNKSSLFSPKKRSRLSFSMEAKTEQQEQIINNSNNYGDFDYRPNKRFCPEIRFNNNNPSSLDLEWEKQQQQQQPINNNNNNNNNKDYDDDEGFGYRPNKRSCPEFMRFRPTSSTVDHLSALFDYIREPEPEWETHQQLLAENKRKENMKKKKKGIMWRRGVSKLTGGFKKLRRDKVVDLAKEKVKAVFGQFWTGDDQSFKWEIQHHTDPLSLPFR